MIFMKKLVERKTYLSLFFRFLKEKNIYIDSYQLSDSYRSLMNCFKHTIVTDTYRLCYENDKQMFLPILMLFLWNVMEHTLFKDEEYVSNLFKMINDDTYKNINNLKEFYLSSYMVHLSYFAYSFKKIANNKNIDIRNMLAKREDEILLPLK